MAITRDHFRKVLGHFATGVTIVTTRLSDGRPWGFTVNSFTSVSLDPPLILVCVDQGTESSRAMAGAEYFAVNFLTEEQQEHSRRFASRLPERFNDVNYSEGLHGSPLLAGSLGYLECKKVASHVHGDHSVIVGEVLEAQVGPGEPLLFFRGAYGRISSTDGSGSKS